MATLTSWLSMVTAAGRGDGIDLGEAAGVGCGAGVAVVLVPVVVDGDISAVLMSVPAFAVKVAWCSGSRRPWSGRRARRRLRRCWRG